jgi:hypothetical protein
VKPMSRFASGFAIGSVSLESLDLRFLTDTVRRRDEDKQGDNRRGWGLQR